MATILCFIESLAVGGAEMTTVRLANAWAAAGHSVHVALIKPTVELLPSPRAWTVYPLTEGGFPDALLSARHLAQCLQPDYIVGHMPKGALLALASRTTGARTILVEHSVPDQHYRGLKKHLVHTLMKFTYGRATRVAAVSHGAAESMIRWGVPAERIAVVGNPIPLEALNEQARNAPHTWRTSLPRLLAMGRLAPEKGFDRLLDALALLQQRGIQFEAQILGEGPCRRALEAQRDALGLTAVVSMPGYCANPYPTLEAADWLVCSSHYEGFGNVLVEALALGVPCVSFDCPSGPRDIIRTPALGHLVTDQSAEGLAAALQTALQRPGGYATAEIKAGARRFDAPCVANQYLALPADA